MVRELIQRWRGYRCGPGTRVSWRSLLHRPGGQLTIGAASLISCRFSFDRAEARIRVGDRCYIGRSHLVSAVGIEIEDDVIISWGVTIVDHNSHALAAEDRLADIQHFAQRQKDWSQVKMAPVTLKKGCWVGFNAAILKGVTVGEGAVVGACSVVTRDVPPHTIVAGNPARVLRHARPVGGEP